ncbi:CHRD domain-containing protein [Herbaspirillum sp. HC18]|nr:CHRD domain-containing protein [Herbaspirillum sp. HC18]
MKLTVSIVRGWLVALAALAFASCGGGGGDSGTTDTSLTQPPPPAQVAGTQELANAFSATLTGAQGVPPRPSAATGSGTVVIDPVTRRMSATLTTTGVAGVNAQIRQGAPSVIGTIIFPLTESPLGSGVWTTRATLTDAQVSSFFAGDFYFNVGSSAFLEGEIRGQILAQISSSAAGSTTVTTPSNVGTPAPAGLVSTVVSSATFLSALRGSQEAPANASVGFGSGTVLVDPVSRQLSAAVTTTGVLGNSAQVREAAPGVNGPIILQMIEAVPGSGIWGVKATLTEAQLSSLQSGNMYFNVFSAAFPNGEIRGQILPQLIPLEGVTGVLGNGASPITSSPATTGATITGFGTTPISTSTPFGTTGTTSTGTGTIPDLTTSTPFGTTGTGTISTGTPFGTTSTGTTGSGITGDTGVGGVPGSTGVGSAIPGVTTTGTPSGTTGALIGM